MSSTNAATTISRPTSASKIAIGVVAAIILAVAVNTLIAAIAHTAGAANNFRPLQIPTFATLTGFGILAATAGWAIIQRQVKRAASLLRWLVPALLAVSLVPDLLLLVSHSQPGTSGLAVSALIIMHLAVATIVVAMLRKTLPVSDRR